MVNEALRHRVLHAVKEQKWLDELAHDIYEEAFGINPDKFVEFIAKNGADVHVSGDMVFFETDQCMGPTGAKRHFDYFPLWWLFDDEWRKNAKPRSWSMATLSGEKCNPDT
jgi:hypothetical protein